MSLIYQQDGSVGAIKTLSFLVRDGSDTGKIAMYSNLTGVVNIKVWTGAAYVAYTVGSAATQLDTTTNVAVIQGPGQFEITIAASKPIAIYASIKASVQLISGFA